MILMDIYFYSSQTIVLFIVALWIMGGKKMKAKKAKDKKAKKEISSEVVEDDYTDRVQEVTSPIPPAPSPKDEDQEIFSEWLNDWMQRFQYFSDPNSVANSTATMIKNQELLFLVGLAHNTDRLISLQRKTNKLLRELIKSQE